MSPITRRRSPEPRLRNRRRRSLRSLRSLRSPRRRNLQHLLQRSRQPAPARSPVNRKPDFARAEKIFSRLEAEYPDAKCALDFKDPLQLLVATILSAQSTDKMVN